MNLTLKVWRQQNPSDKGGFKEYKLSGISADMSFLEMFKHIDHYMERLALSQL